VDVQTVGSRRKQRSQKTGRCIYCGSQGPVTDDHVPPRSFYPQNPPKNLITVPCCSVCNSEFAKNDDYVRLVLTTTEGAMGNPARDELIPAVKRFAERQESKRILKSLYGSLESGYYPNAAGLFVRRENFIVEGERLDGFAKRVVKALFFREKGHRLPDGYLLIAINHRRMEEIERSSGDNRDFWPFVITELIERGQRQAWGDVFAYSWIQSANDPDATWWLLEFYGTPQYLCSTWSESAAAGWPRG
jgi:hypothetical protein